MVDKLQPYEHRAKSVIHPEIDIEFEVHAGAFIALDTFRAKRNSWRGCHDLAKLKWTR